MKRASGLLLAGLVFLLSIGRAAALVPATSACFWPSVSSNGSVIALYSSSTGWTGAAGSSLRVFVVSHARRSVVNTSVNGPYSANSGCLAPQISANGRWLVYHSGANNLVGGFPEFSDTNGLTDIFVCEITDNHFTEPAPAFSHHIVSISSEGSQADNNCLYPRISGDGRFVVFQSAATNLVPDDTHPGNDIFVHDRDFNTNGIFDEVSVTNGVRTIRVSFEPDETDFPNDFISRATISDDGRYVAFTGNGYVWTRDRDVDGNGVFDEPGGARTYRTSYVSGGGGSDLSPCGRYTGSKRVVSSKQTVFLFDGVVSNYMRVSEPVVGGPSSGSANHPVVGEGGMNVAFMSASTNLTDLDSNGRQDVFLRIPPANNPMTNESFELVSVSSLGEQGNNHSGGNLDTLNTDFDICIDMSPDARYVLYTSLATNLVENDVNGVADVFIRDRLLGTTERIENDDQGPSWAGGSHASVLAVGVETASISWSPAADDVGIWRYAVTWNLQTEYVSAHATNLMIHGLLPGSTTEIEVRAYDLAGNLSTTTLVVDVVTLPAPEDSDADGMPDAWETTWFNDPTNAAPGGDDDGDLENNLAEYIADTVPVGTAGLVSVFELDGLSNATTRRIWFDASGNRIYDFDAFRGSYTGGAWNILQSTVWGSGAMMQFEDGASSSSSTYRVRVRVP